MPDKWKRIWAERHRRALAMQVLPEESAEEAIRSGEVAMCLVRGPIGRDGMHLIPLYDEAPTIVVGKEHPAAAYDELPLAELADDPDILATNPDISMSEAFATVAAGTGHLLVPRSVARINQRKDVAFIHASDAPRTKVGLAWLIANDDPDVETFIGIVRGRTARSSR